jgi:hypothetical protein
VVQDIAGVQPDLKAPALAETRTASNPETVDVLVLVLISVATTLPPP